MSKRLLRLGFDIDGVLADFASAFVDMTNQQFGTDLEVENWTDYGGEQPPSLFTPEQWAKGWEIIPQTPFFWARLDSMPEVNFDLLNRQMETFLFNGYFVTRRMNLNAEGIGDANALTRIWLENNGLEHYSSVIAHTKSDQRIRILQDYEVDAYLDDWGEQFIKCQEAGINAWLIDRPYNRYLETDKRVHSVQEFVTKTTGVMWPDVAVAPGSPEVVPRRAAAPGA